MSEWEPSAQALKLERRILQQIPLLVAMDLKLVSYDGQTLQLSAPLEANINDKGTAFGGSLATLATITGWCYTTLLAEQLGDNEVVVADSRISYLKPLKSTLISHCTVSDPKHIEDFLTRLQHAGRANLQLHVTIGHESPVLEFSGRYAALLKDNK